MTGNQTATLVVELSTEELPPKALKQLGETFGEVIYRSLTEAEFVAEGAGEMQSWAWYATPRRLAVSIRNVRAVAPDSEVISKLMPLAVAKGAHGAPTEALQRKLAAMGRTQLAEGFPDAWDGSNHLYVASDGKVDAVYLRSLAKGQALQLGLGAALDEAIDKLPIPKAMSYARPRGGYYNEIKFVRPAHRLVALHGERIVPVAALGLDAGRHTDGHRFLSRTDIEIATADAYQATLEAEGKVLPSFAERRAKIVKQLETAAAGARVIMPDVLLDEVTALVEWPKVYTGGFDPAFLAVPQECLILTMQQNQKYFALADAGGKLQNRFLLVSNLDTHDPQAIIRGNERVLRARLADAKFFFDQDRKHKLETRVPKLVGVVYHNKLGNQLDRIERVRAIARFVVQYTGADAALVDRAVYLAKADLLTDMVGEFPELQGLMGRYYALHDGEGAEVAAAIEQHYWPRFAGDALPQGPVAVAVALADKLESLAGMFGVGNIPTGDRDPFGLRRQALGVLRILMDGRLSLALDRLIDAGFAAFDLTFVRPAHTELETFIFERLRAYLRDQGYSANQVEAVLCTRPSRIDLVPARMEAIKTFAGLPEAEALAAANKRIGNILRKADSEGAPAVDRSLLTDGAERELYATVQRLLPVVRGHVERADYTEALRVLASARSSVDRFFDDVLVMTDDLALRANRLALLRGLAEAMNQVADISKLAA